MRLLSLAIFIIRPGFYMIGRLQFPLISVWFIFVQKNLLKIYLRQHSWLYSIFSYWYSWYTVIIVRRNSICPTQRLRYNVNHYGLRTPIALYRCVNSFVIVVSAHRCVTFPINTKLPPMKSSINFLIPKCYHLWKFVNQLRW